MGYNTPFPLLLAQSYRNANEAVALLVVQADVWLQPDPGAVTCPNSSFEPARKLRVVTVQYLALFRLCKVPTSPRNPWPTYIRDWKPTPRPW